MSNSKYFDGEEIQYQMSKLALCQAEMQKLMIDLKQKMTDFDELALRDTDLEVACALPPRTTMETVDNFLMDDDFQSVKSSVYKELPVFQLTSANKLMIEVNTLIREVRQRPAPDFRLKKVTVCKKRDIFSENVTRKRIVSLDHPLKVDEKSGKPITIGNSTTAVTAPSVRIHPLPTNCKDILNLSSTLAELGVPDLLHSSDGAQNVYMVNSRVFSKDQVKEMIGKRAEVLLMQRESQNVNQGTQTYVTTIGDQFMEGCVQCLSSKHHFKNCCMPPRQGYCSVCGAPGFDAANCIFPHGIEDYPIPGRCTGCERETWLFCPDCPDCNIRFAGIADWSCLNYSTWPLWLSSQDNKHLNKTNEEALKRKIKAKFNCPTNLSTRIRHFLIRENVFQDINIFANPKTKNSKQLSEEKMRRATKAFAGPLTKKTVDEIMKERSELSDGQEIIVIVPTKFKRSTE